MTERTVLYEAHLALGADMVPFAGYEMPVRYKNSNIIDEHMAVRENVGMFDVSHMGRYWVVGKDAKEFLDFLVPRNIMALTPGRAGYSFMLNERGGFKDDVIVSQLDEDEFMVVCNAGNRKKIWYWMSSLLKLWQKAGKEAKLIDRSDISCMIAVQGPKSMNLLSELFNDELPDKRFRLKTVEFQGTSIIISTTGYTGEDGAELILMGEKDTIASQARNLWDALLDKGVKPCALGSRDTLRLEAGYCLYGNDIDEDTHLLESGLDFKPFAVLEKETGYMGQEAVLDKQGKIERVRVGFKLLGKGIPRHGYRVIIDGKEAGVVTSGTQSPLTKESIGMAYVPVSHSAVGSIIQIEMRKKLVDAQVINFPTYDTSKYGLKRTQ